MSLDPQIAALLAELDAGFPPVHTMSGPEARAAIRSRFVPNPHPEPVAEVNDVDVGPLRARHYRPAAATPLPILMFAHGGGFVFCDLDTHDGLCRALANLIPAVVISVDYRLAPEHPWPTAAEDVYAVTQWAAEHAEHLGGDARRIAVGGDSAGGNLAAVTALIARDRGGPAIAGQLLLYPVLAADFTTQSYRLFGEGYYNPATAMRWYWDQYLPTPADRAHPHASPLMAELAGLPPAVIVVAGHDPLRDEGLAYCDALTSAGVPHVFARFDGAIHGFMTMPTLELAQAARQRVARELGALLSR